MHLMATYLPFLMLCAFSTSENVPSPFFATSRYLCMVAHAHTGRLRTQAYENRLLLALCFAVLLELALRSGAQNNKVLTTFEAWCLKQMLLNCRHRRQAEQKPMVRGLCCSGVEGNMTLYATKVIERVAKCAAGCLQGCTLALEWVRATQANQLGWLPTSHHVGSRRCASKKTCSMGFALAFKWYNASICFEHLDKGMEDRFAIIVSVYSCAPEARTLPNSNNNRAKQKSCQVLPHSTPSTTAPSPRQSRPARDAE